MKFLAFPISLILAAAFVAAEDTPTTSAVVQLNESNIHSFIKENESVLLKFYAPWCMHCQSLAPEYEKAANLLREEGSPIILAEINCDGAPGISQEFKIEGYPTLKFYRNGVARDYSGNRQADGIVEWCKSIMVPAIVKISSADEVDDFSTINFVLSGYGETDELYKEFENLADLYRDDAKFFYAPEDGKRIIVIHKDQSKYQFEGSSAEELVEFVQQESLPLFDEIGHSNYVRYFSSGKAISWFCGQKDDYETYRHTFVKVARDLRASTHFVWLDTEKFTAAGEAFAISSFPAVAYQTEHGRYILNSDAYDFNNHTSVLQFYSDVEAGKITRSIKSEEEPEENDGPIVTLVGKTLVKFVENARKPILLMIHSPFCEHCKRFMPVFTSYGEAVGKDGKVTVATINGDANESGLDYIQWKAYPTVLLINPGSTEVVPYQGNRTLEDLTTFVDENVVEERHSEL